MADPFLELQFPIGDQVRYKPNACVYGYEDTVEADGRVPGIVVGYSRTRVRVRMRNNSGLVDRAVNARSLIRGKSS